MKNWQKSEKMGSIDKNKKLKNNFMSLKSILCFVGILAVLLTAVSVSAQGLKGAGGIVGQVAQKSGANTYTSPQQLVGTIINAALTMVGLIFLVLMIYAGYLWLTAKGEEEPIKKAQKIIVSSIIGFVLVASAYAITTFIGKRFETGGGGEGNVSEGCEGKTGQKVAGCDTCIEFAKQGFSCLPDNECDQKTKKINYCNAPGQDDLYCCQPELEFEESDADIVNGFCYFKDPNLGDEEQEIKDVTFNFCKAWCLNDKTGAATGCTWYEQAK